MNPEWGLQCPGLSVPHFFGTRQVPALLEDRIQLGMVTEGSVDVPLMASLKQIHSTRTVLLKSPVTPGPLSNEEGDSLVTDHPRTMVIVRTADCVPVLLADEEAGVVAAIHAGWRGAVAGIVPQTIEVCLMKFGATPKGLRAAIGPSIGSCCYEVDSPVIGPIRSGYSWWREVLRDTVPGKARLDLKRLIRHQLAQAGLLPDRIEQVDLCTHCRSDLFHSYRREGRVMGTMLSGVMLHAER